MVRECASCYFTGGRKKYSASQWSKGEGVSRCPTCVASAGGGGSPQYGYYTSSDDEDPYAYETGCHECSQCGKEFWEYNYANDRAAREACERHERDAHSAQRMKLYHGTSWIRAQKIERDGFVESSTGLLGPGIYLAREDKARRFAEDVDRHGSAQGGLVECLVTVYNPKYASSNDTGWRKQGHDACRADHTTGSRHMEWCIRDRSQVEVIRIQGPFDLRSVACLICGNKKQFAHLQHAIQHVESGYCTGCPGQANARAQIFQFVQGQSGQQLLGDRAPVVQLDRYGNQVVPDKPYGCGSCGKHFAAVSSLMSHTRATGH